MGMKKRVLAAVLAAAMTLGAAASAFAATGSPQPTPEPDKKNYIDINSQDHGKIVVTSEITNNKGHVTKITSSADSSAKSKVVTLRVARNVKNKQVPITYVGDGTKGIFDNKTGRNVTRLNLKSTPKWMVLRKNSFKNSNVNKVVVSKGTKVNFKKDAFKSTKKKSAQITLNVNKSADIKASKGAFSGLDKNATVIIRSKKHSTYTILKKKLVAAGFKGKITWKQV